MRAIDLEVDVSDQGVTPISEVARRIEEARAARADRDRSFEIGGKTFTHKPAVAPETLARYYDMTAGLRAGITNEEAIAIIDETVLGLLDPGQEDAWYEVRDPNISNPLTHNDLHALIEGLLAVVTDRPIGPPSDSTDGQEEKPTKSTAGSRSKVPAART